MVDPDRPDHPAAGADRHRRTRIEIGDLVELTLENLEQRLLVRGHHAVRLQHAPVQLPHPQRVGNLPAEDRAAPRRVDRLVAERREGEHATRRVLDRHGSSDHPRDRVRQGEQVSDRHSRDPAAAVVHLDREAARVEQERVQLRPGHLLRHGEDRHAGGRLRLTEARGIASALEHDGARLAPLGVQQQLRRLRRPRPNRDGEHDHTGRDRRVLALVVDHRLPDGHLEAARRRDQLHDVAAEAFQQRLEIRGLVAAARHQVNAIALLMRLGKRARREEAEEIAACDAVDVRVRVAVGAQRLEQAGVVARPLEPFHRRLDVDAVL